MKEGEAGSRACESRAGSREGRLVLMVGRQVERSSARPKEETKDDAPNQPQPPQRVDGSRARRTSFGTTSGVGIVYTSCTLWALFGRHANALRQLALECLEILAIARQLHRVSPIFDQVGAEPSQQGRFRVRTDHI